jgi:hypothetical protein
MRIDVQVMRADDSSRHSADPSIRTDFRYGTTGLLGDPQVAAARHDQAAWPAQFHSEDGGRNARRRFDGGPDDSLGRNWVGRKCGIQDQDSSEQNSILNEMGWGHETLHSSLFGNADKATTVPHEPADDEPIV